VKKRLAALAFAINSINTSTKNLLKVSDLLKEVGKDARNIGKIRLDKYLKPSQVAVLRQVLSEEPLNCAKKREPKDAVLGFLRRQDSFDERGNKKRGEDDGQPEAEPLRADVIVKAIMDQTNYYKLLELSNSRRGFELDEGIAADLDVDGPEKDRSEDTLRLILPPGKSGVAHDNSQRLIVLQKTRDGRVVVRTGDVDKHEATKGNRNFVQRPATARPSGSEEIWELPNGMRAYSARNEAGQLVAQVPHGLVKPTITNPRTCFSCHGGTGFIAGSGEFGGVAHTETTPIKKVGVVDETVRGKTFGNRNLFKATWDDYMAAIAPANTRYDKAIEKMGADPKKMRSVLDAYAGNVTVDKLAAELGVDKDEVERALLTKRFKSAWDPSGEFDPKDKDAKIELTRSSLETEIDLGAGKGDERNKRTLYCALKDITKEQQAKLLRPKRSEDAVVRGKGRPSPSVGPKPVHDVAL
jgi:hypothetical protein